MGLISAFVATYANTATSAPIYICAALYIAMVGQAQLCASLALFAALTIFTLGERGSNYAF